LSTRAEEQRRLRRELEQRGIRDSRVLAVIEKTPRDAFIPAPLRDEAYEDTALPIGQGQTISQPYIVALMTQALELNGTETVLEVGTGSGYQAAILAPLCRKVVTIDRIEDLSRSARYVLNELGINNVEFLIGDGTLGNPERGPYDRIIVTASAPDVPKPLYEQLAPGGRLVVPVGDESQQDLIVVEKTESGPRTTPLCACRFVKLIGQAGWPSTPGETND
jgi:protein-L-isoaspartate(D-aspartate) O-methyltransferase